MISHRIIILSATMAELARMTEPVAIMRSEVARCFEQLGLCYELDFTCDFVSLYTIDFALVSPGRDSEHVAIMVDGLSYKPCLPRVRDRLHRALRLSLGEWSQSDKVRVPCSLLPRSGRVS